MNAVGSETAGADLQKPVLQLRKGTVQTLLGTTTTITNIAFTLPVDASGSGTRGLGSVISGNYAALVLTLGNGSKVAWTWEDPAPPSSGGEE